MTDAEIIQREMTWTTWGDSCRSDTIIDGEQRECRRTKGHEGFHASGFYLHFRFWE